MKRASTQGAELVDFLASRAHAHYATGDLQRTDSSGDSNGATGATREEEPAEKMRRLNRETQHRGQVRNGQDALSSSSSRFVVGGTDGGTIELSAEEAVALGMVDGVTDGGSFTIEDEPLSGNLVIQHMNIEEPLTTLKALLEQRLCCNLEEYEFWLQNQQLLDPDKNLVEQCVQGEGMVQVNCEIGEYPGVETPRINIVDILKPAEEVTEGASEEGYDEFLSTVPERQSSTPQKDPLPPSDPKQGESEIPKKKEEQVTRWVVDQQFRKDQEKLGIPLDPISWTTSHVRHWIRWAIDKFRLTGVNANEWIHITGKDLADMTHEMFAALVPLDKGDLFWTHLELLRKCKFVAIVQAQPKNPVGKPSTSNNSTVSVRQSDGSRFSPVQGASQSPVHNTSASLYNMNNLNNNNNNGRPRSPRISGDEGRLPASNIRASNNGQIQLWQFLLELLTDYSCREAIHWVGEEGEFKLHNPELVAQMWGQRKNKPTMNYDKLSRALRYYYDGDMITKVQGKRFVYKFVCDLKMLLGYSPKELAGLVQECAAKKASRSAEMQVRCGLGLEGDANLVNPDEDEDSQDAATLALQSAVNNLSQLSASGGHVSLGIGGGGASSLGFPASSSTLPRILVRKTTPSSGAGVVSMRTPGHVGDLALDAMGVD